MALRVTVDLDSCQGYVCCVMEAPEVFDVGEATGKAVLLQAEPDESLRAGVEAAARACPARAITVEDR
jgi:ferredoxin